LKTTSRSSVAQTANVLPRTDERSLGGGYPIAEIIPLGMHGFHPVGSREETMSSKFDKELGSLSWTKHELTRGRMSRREFVQLAMAAGLGVSAAHTLLARAQAASPKKGGRLRVAISWGSTTNSLDPATYLDNYMFTIALTIGSLLAQVDESGNIGTDLALRFTMASLSGQKM
jgi:hypothetical protein